MILVNNTTTLVTTILLTSPINQNMNLTHLLITYHTMNLTHQSTRTKSLATQMYMNIVCHFRRVLGMIIRTRHSTTSMTIHMNKDTTMKMASNIKTTMLHLMTITSIIQMRRPSILLKRNRPCILLQKNHSNKLKTTILNKGTTMNLSHTKQKQTTTLLKKQTTTPPKLRMIMETTPLR